MSEYASHWEQEEVEYITEYHPEYLTKSIEELEQEVDDLYAQGESKIDEGYNLESLGDSIRNYINYKKRKMAEEKMSDIHWKPLFPNNMPDNPKAGIYCVITDLSHRLTRKYTILYQMSENANKVQTGMIEYYILFEKVYPNKIVGPFEHPAPSNRHIDENKENTFTSYELNDYGSFVRAFIGEDMAKERALYQYHCISELMDTYV
jgi:hypothetical protein